ncbi:hypothetical protein [Streptomyces sp. Da 82-17]|uniref:hypothetical protein n=1 Tax=Streptomyces sp. Da 82-17 TaxID=3377116 RepID=UPI0038D492A5
MPDNDPIEELADVLYRSLSAIHPFAEIYFAEQTEGLQNAVRALLDQAAAQQWIQTQLDQTALKAADFRNGMAMELEPARELVAHWVGAARTMLGDAPNYTETPIQMEVKVAESPERYAFVLQRIAPGALTPHQARQKAEAALNRVRALHQPLEHAGLVLCAHCSGWNGMWLFNGARNYPCDTLTALTEPSEPPSA